jgi:hypothetical protein
MTKLIASHNRFGDEVTRHGTRESLIGMAELLIKFTLGCDMLTYEGAPPLREELSTVLQHLNEFGEFDGYGIKLRLEE